MPDEVAAVAEAPVEAAPPAQLNLFSEMADTYEKTDAGEPPTPVMAESVAESSALPSEPEPILAQSAPASAEAPPTPPTPAQPVQQQAQPQPPPTTDEILARRAAYLAQLAQQYSIPEDQIDLLTTEPHKVLPNLAANVAMNTYEAVTQYFNSMMPQYIMHVLQQNAIQRNGTDRFYEQWPQLRSDDPNVMKTISTVAIAYRRANPTASVEEAIAKVGAASSAMLGLAPTPKPAQAPRTPSAKPFSHAGAGVAGTPAPAPRAGTAQEGNYFADLVAGLDLSEL